MWGMTPHNVLLSACLAAIGLGLQPGTPATPQSGKPSAPSTPQPTPSAPAGAPEGAAPTPPPLPYPHPIISEVLYAVPAGDGGDANKDGNRHSAGDEFVELYNPHDKPIQLLGYTINDRNPPRKGQLKFTFPALELPAHRAVVVFNGNEQTWTHAGPVGDASKAPAGPSKVFFDAYVFTMRCPSARTSWSNTGDYVLLSDPAGTPLECVTWGTYKEPTPAATLVEQAPLTSKGSVQRISPTGPFVPHIDLSAPAKPGGPKASGVPCSPGWFEPLPGGAATPGTPTPPDPPPPDKPTPKQPHAFPDLKLPAPKHK
jgi:hypothetical protein